MCSRCGHRKEIEDFPDQSDGEPPCCVACLVNGKAPAARKTRPLVMTPSVAFKQCRRCQTEKPADNFHCCRTHRDGLDTYCKICQVNPVNVSHESQCTGGCIQFTGCSINGMASGCKSELLFLLTLLVLAEYSMQHTEPAKLPHRDCMMKLDWAKHLSLSESHAVLTSCTAACSLYWAGQPCAVVG